MFGKANLITFICLFAVSLGFMGIHEGHVETGRNLINTTVSGFFGYSIQDNLHHPELVFLLVIITGAYLTYFLSSNSTFSESIGIVSTAIGGYLGYLTQNNKKED